MQQNDSVSLEKDRALFEHFSGLGESIDPEAQKKEYFLKKLFAYMDNNPIYLNGQKWTREELYED